MRVQMADAATVEYARSVIFDGQESVDQIIGGDVELVHGEILSRGRQ